MYPLRLIWLLALWAPAVMANTPAIAPGMRVDCRIERWERAIGEGKAKQVSHGHCGSAPPCRQRYQAIRLAAPEWKLDYGAWVRWRDIRHAGRVGGQIATIRLPDGQFHLREDSESDAGAAQDRVIQRLELFGHCKPARRAH